MKKNIKKHSLKRHYSSDSSKNSEMTCNCYQFQPRCALHSSSKSSRLIKTHVEKLKRKILWLKKLIFFYHSASDLQVKYINLVPLKIAWPSMRQSGPIVATSSSPSPDHHLPKNTTCQIKNKNQIQRLQHDKYIKKQKEPFHLKQTKATTSKLI